MSGRTVISQPRKSKSIIPWQKVVRTRIYLQVFSVLFILNGLALYSVLTFFQITHFWLSNVLLALGLGGVMAHLMAYRMAFPVVALQRLTRKIAKGALTPIHLPYQNEFADLANELNQLSSEFGKKVSQISLERAQIKAMLSGMVEGIVAVDADQKILFCNQAAYRLLDSRLKDARGCSVQEADGFERLEKIVSDVFAKKELIQEEMIIENPFRRLELFASIFQGLDARGVMMVLHDVSKIKELERIRRDFVANVSHELKTPLTTIVGYVETLRDETDPQLQKKFLGKISSNTKRLQDLVHEILDLARLESRQDSTKNPTQLIQVDKQNWVSIVKTVLQRYMDAAEKKSIDLILEEPSKEVYVMGDKEALLRIMDNLVSNALRYTPTGGRVLVRFQQDGQNISAQVMDTGIGIAEKYQKRIFERFYRVDKERSRQLGGSGLGLSIVKNLVLAMDGKIYVESTPGTGTKFNIVLPGFKVSEHDLK